MAVTPGPLTPPEVVLVLVALGGVVPILVYRRALAWWIVLPYLFLCLGAITTTVEHLYFYSALNAIEHSVANMGAGLAFALAAYIGHQRLKASALDSVEE